MISVFDEEISRIKSPDVAALVRKVLEAVEEDPILGPDLFLSPAAKSKMIKGVSHHPDVCRVPGGLVLHVKRAVSAGAEFCNALKFTQAQSDQVIAALLIHDIFKHRDFRAHGRLAGELAGNVMMKPENAELLSRIGAQAIINIGLCCNFHMGPFTLDASAKPMEKFSLMELITYLSDYTAARRDIMMPVDSFDLGPVVEYWTAKRTAA